MKASCSWYFVYTNCNGEPFRAFLLETLMACLIYTVVVRRIFLAGRVF